MKNRLGLKNFGLTVSVENDNVDKALKKFKKKVNNSGILQDVRNRTEYVKPTTKRKIAKSSAKKRWKKYLQSQVLPPKNY